jgi:hypothetical protein
MLPGSIPVAPTPQAELQIVRRRLIAYSRLDALTAFIIAMELRLHLR